jgi:DNA-binding SARP family transcriptional activator/tetratricopeptide (TPR) repeat protein
MWVGVLGPLEVSHDGVTLPVRAAKHRIVLATLLVHANQVVSFDALAETLWDGSPASGARVTVRNYVFRLRQVLGSEVGSRIVTLDPGYEFRADDGELDLLKFQALCRDGGGAVRRADWPRARRVLAAALALWRGPALADVGSELLHRDHAPRLEQMRLQAVEWRADADLHLGDCADLAGELQSLTALHPLRERFHAQLMLALYRTGRQAEALVAYRDARRILSEELGIEPGLELQLLHEAILRGDAGLESAEPRHGSAAPAARVTPRQLPTAPAHFVGRDSELTVLSGLLDQAGLGTGTAVISAIAGMPGVGKTALAVQWSHSVSGHFPDGQLYVNLRGYDPLAAPLDPGEVLGGFLAALGVAAGSVPADMPARTALYRSLLAGTRMLVLLDNACDEQQVRPLLPGSGGCLALVTSRTGLTGLVAAEGARPVWLDVLTSGESHELLARRLGSNRVTAEPVATAELITLCGGLPLALNIAAARASGRSSATIGDIAADLRHDQLDALDPGDPATSVRTVFSSSYGDLSAGAARTFRLLGLHPGPDFSLLAAASLLGATRSQARAALSELTRAHLLAEPAPARFAFHDLIRSYAAERAERDSSVGERTTAIHRMLDHYLHTAAAAALVLRPSRPPLTLPARQPGVTPEDLAGHAQALAWLKAEYPVLLSGIALAAESGFATHTWQIARALTDFSFRQGLVNECASVQQMVISVCDQAGDDRGKADALIALANARERLGDYDRAFDCLREALSLFDQLGDRVGEGRVHHGLSRVYERQRRLTKALAHAAEAAAHFRACGERGQEARALNGVGWFHAQLGSYQQALTYCQQALRLQRELGDLSEQAATLDSLGYAHCRLGEHEASVACFREALHLFTAVGDQVSTAVALTHLGEAYQLIGDLDAVFATWRQALAILDDIGHPDADEVRAKLTDLAAPPSPQLMGNRQ